MGSAFIKGLILYEYKELVFAGITGTMERELYKTGPLISAQYPNIEVSPIQFQSKRRFLALFGDNPTLDITLDQYNPIENSMVGYALNKRRLIGRMGWLSKLIGFVPHQKQDLTVAQTWEREFEIERAGYASYEKLSSLTKQPLEKVFGLVRYTNFLAQYIGKSEEESMKLASKKFNVSLP